MNPDPGRFIEVNGISLYVEEHGAGVPVLLMHGFPDSARLWRNQVPFLVSNGFRVITPDMRGFGRSGRPQEVAAYRLPNVVADVTGLLDALGIEASSAMTGARRWHGSQPHSPPTGSARSWSSRGRPRSRPSPRRSTRMRGISCSSRLPAFPRR